MFHCDGTIIWDVPSQKTLGPWLPLQRDVQTRVPEFSQNLHICNTVECLYLGLLWSCARFTLCWGLSVRLHKSGNLLVLQLVVVHNLYIWKSVSTPISTSASTTNNLLTFSPDSVTTKRVGNLVISYLSTWNFSPFYMEFHRNLTNSLGRFFDLCDGDAVVELDWNCLV